MERNKLSKHDARKIVKEEKTFLKEFLFDNNDANLLSVDTAMLLAEYLRIQHDEAFAILIAVSRVLEDMLSADKVFALPGTFRMYLDGKKSKIRVRYNNKFRRRVIDYFSTGVGSSIAVARRRSILKTISRNKQKVINYMFGFWEAQQGIMDSMPVTVAYPKIQLRAHLLKKLDDTDGRKLKRWKYRQRMLEARHQKD